METVQNLLILYAVVVFFNTLLSAYLWMKEKSRIYLAQMLAWGTTFGAYLLQGVFSQNELLIALSFSTCFKMSASFFFGLSCISILGFPPSMMSVPRPAILVEIVTLPALPAWAMMWASFSCCLAFKTS